MNDCIYNVMYFNIISFTFAFVFAGVSFSIKPKDSGEAPAVNARPSSLLTDTDDEDASHPHSSDVTHRNIDASGGDAEYNAIMAATRAPPSVDSKKSGWFSCIYSV